MTPIPIVGFVADWPVWLWAVASLGVAFVWLSLSTWIINVFRRRLSDSPVPTQKAETESGDVQQIQIQGNENAAQSMQNSPGAMMAGRDLNNIIVDPNSLSRLQSPPAILRLSDPFRVLKQIAEIKVNGHIQTIGDLTLWRIRLENKQHSTRATNLVIRLESSEPAIEFLYVVLHEMNDNNFPYRLEHTLSDTQPKTFDVISRSEETGRLYVYRADKNLYAYPVQNPECYDAVSSSGIRLTITVSANSPVEPIEKVFIVRLDNGEFIMESLE